MAQPPKPAETPAASGAGEAAQENPKPGTGNAGATETGNQNASPAEKASYIVRSGQSLWSIAKEKFGKGILYKGILDQNPVLRAHPDLIQPGQVLKLPESGG
jgi:5'-nucleotidase